VSSVRFWSFSIKVSRGKKKEKKEDIHNNKKNNGSSNCGERIKKKKKFCGKKISMQYIRRFVNKFH
jgi:hypothetical protein